jgi:hypothetical protein
MKKIISLFFLIFAFTLTTQAQKKGSKLKVEKMLAKMTADLNLTDKQQSKIKPLLVAQIADKKLLSKRRKDLKDAGVKPSKKENKKMKEERSTKENIMNSKMSKILSKEQFLKFEIILKEQKEKAKKKKINNKS